MVANSMVVRILQRDRAEWRRPVKKLAVLVGSALVAASLLAGCATAQDVLTSKEEGTAVVYAVAPSRAFDIAVQVLREDGVTLIEQHRSEGYMLTTFDASFVAVWVDADQGGSLVTVRSKRLTPLSILGFLESTFHDDFRRVVEGKGRPAVMTLAE